jgi:hypothetical protein
MNHRRKEDVMTKLLICLALGAMTSQAATVTYDLASDFSDTDNPNGVWSFDQGTTPLPFRNAPTDSNALNGAAENGYFGVASDFSTAPFILQATEDGSSATGYSDDDFVTGDVLVHSTSPGGGAPVFIDWTAPSAGTITFSGQVWYAHSPVTRSNDYAIALGSGPDIFTGTVTNGDGLSAPSTFADSNVQTVTAGEVLALELSPTEGQNFGSLAGVDLTVNFTSAAPEPGTIWLFIGALPIIALAAKRRRSPKSL